jgi:hypothetical protein
LFQVLRRFPSNPAKLRMGVALLFSAHHFINYAKSVVEELEAELRGLGRVEACEILEESQAVPAWQAAELAGAVPASAPPALD